MLSHRKPIMRCTKFGKRRSSSEVVERSTYRDQSRMLHCLLVSSFFHASHLYSLPYSSTQPLSPATSPLFLSSFLRLFRPLTRMIWCLRRHCVVYFPRSPHTDVSVSHSRLSHDNRIANISQLLAYGDAALIHCLAGPSLCC
jgi:hypothetical protein